MIESLIIRNAHPQDLDAIMRVEQDWPEGQRAGRDKFVSRLERFPDGFFLAEADGQVVGVSTSTLTYYNSSRLELFKSWDHCTNNGFFYPLKPLAEYNALYIVSNGILIPYRRTGIRESLITAHLKLAEKMDLAYTVTGAMLPGYDKYCRQNGDIAAHAYAFLKEGGKLVDPTLRKLDALGLSLPDERHIVKDFYCSPESRNYGALLVHKTKG